MSAINFTDSISALIQKEVEAALLSLRGKFFKDLGASEDNGEIDVTKFAQNTVKKIIESEDYSNIIKSVSAFAEKKEKVEKADKGEKKDPEAPKGAKNAYIFFCNDVRATVKADNASFKATEIVKKMGEMWKGVSSAKKAEYQEMADDDKKRYAAELSSYEPKEGFKNPKEKSKKSKKTESTAPKRGRSSYIYFCGEKRGEVKKKNPKISNTEILSELGKMWKALSDKKKKPYTEMAEADKKRYEEEKSKGKKGVKNVKNIKVSNRTPSGYLLFCKDKRQQVKDENPSSKMTEITTILGSMWKDLSDKNKKPYMEMAEKLKKAKASENVEEKEIDSEEEDDEDSDEESLFSDDEEEESSIPIPAKTVSKAVFKTTKKQSI